MISARVSDRLAKLLAKAAKRAKVSVSELLRALIESHCKKGGLK